MKTALLTLLLLFTAVATLTAQALPTIQMQFVGFDKKAVGVILFRVNGKDLRLTSPDIPGTNYKYTEFSLAEDLNPTTGEKTDVSTLKLVHTQTRKTVKLILGQTVDVPQ